MVAISNEAAALIRSLIERSELPQTGGLRVGTDDEKHSLAMSLVPAPREHDVVVQQGGATLFVSPVAARRLAGQRLHAQLEERPAFFVD